MEYKNSYQTIEVVRMSNLFDTEATKTISRFVGNYADVENYLDEKSIDLDVAKFQLLSTIDPYGETVFSYAQSKQVAIELGHLQNIIEDVAIQQIVERLVEYINVAASHEFIIFFGD